MSIEADINWIKTELEKIKDPFLIEAFKNLLNYRKQKLTNTKLTVEEILTIRALKSEDDIEKGRVMTRQQMDDRTK